MNKTTISQLYNKHPIDMSTVDYNTTYIPVDQNIDGAVVTGATSVKEIIDVMGHATGNVTSVNSLIGDVVLTGSNIDTSSTDNTSISDTIDGIKADISNINGLIPNEATSINQLVDKDYVDDKFSDALEKSGSQAVYNSNMDISYYDGTNMSRLAMSPTSISIHGKDTGVDDIPKIEVDPTSHSAKMGIYGDDGDGNPDWSVVKSEISVNDNDISLSSISSAYDNTGINASIKVNPKESNDDFIKLFVKNENTSAQSELSVSDNSILAISNDIIGATNTLSLSDKASLRSEDSDWSEVSLNGGDITIYSTDEDNTSRITMNKVSTNINSEVTLSKKTFTRTPSTGSIYIDDTDGLHIYYNGSWHTYTPAT